MTSASTHGTQHWAKPDIAEEYDSSGGKLMRSPIDALLAQSGVVAAALNGESVSLWDNACGTGNLASYFHDAVGDGRSQQCEITCTDLSAAMIDSVKKRAVAEGWANASVLVADAQDAKLPSSTFTHALTSFGFGNFPSSDKALDEISRCLAPGGVLGITTWQSLGWPLVVQRVLQLLGSPLVVGNILKAYQPKSGYDWSSPDEIRNLLSSRGYTDVSIEIHHSVTRLTKEEVVGNKGWMRMFTGLMGTFSEDERKEWADKLVPTLESRWMDLFGEKGLAEMPMVAIISTARKPQM